MDEHFSSILWRCNFKLIGYVPLASNFDSLGFDAALLFFRPDWTPQRNLAVLGDDLDVVGVDRERAVVVERSANLLGNGAVRGIHLLLVGGGIALVFVLFGVVRWRLLRILVSWR